MSATFGRAAIATRYTRALMCSFFALPLVTFKIIAAIHWEALRLWLKGARLVPRNKATPNIAADPAVASGARNDYIGTALYARGRETGSVSALWSDR
jgi:uncharacterized protein